MKKIYIKLIIVCMLWFSVLAYGHGLKFKIEKKYPCVLVTSMYHGGTAVRGGGVNIFYIEPGAASAAKKEFQKGRTDRNGNFVFKPDKEGVYRFSTDDGMGHRSKLAIKINAEFFRAVNVEENKPASKGRGDFFEKSPPSPSQKTPDKALRENVGIPKETNSANAPAGFFYCKVMLGLVLILLFTFLFYTWKRKREKSNQNTET